MRKISWFGHVSRHKTLENTILKVRVEGTRKIGQYEEVQSLDERHLSVDRYIYSILT